MMLSTDTTRYRASWESCVSLAGIAVALCLVGASLSAPSLASAASTCPGHNGEIAVLNSSPTKNVIGVLSPNRRLRTVYEASSGGGTQGGGRSIFDLSFSCNGGQIAFAENNLSDCNLLAVVAVKTGRRREVDTPHLCAGAPAFLADGKIAFSASSANGRRRSGTYVVSSDGSHLRRRFGRKELAASSGGRWFVGADPNGKLRSLYLLDARGNVVRRLTPTAPAGSEYINPHFSADARWIVFEERHFLGSRLHDVLYMVRRDGSHRRRLTSGPESSSEPTFSPDGRWIAFTRSKEGPSGNVFALSVRNPSKIKEMGLSSSYQYPTWGAQ
jgi:Tol biopolymer transport system component